MMQAARFVVLACVAAGGGAVGGIAPAPSPAPANPLVGVWARVSGGRCRFEQVEFAPAQITVQPTAPGAPMRTAAASYDLSDVSAPRVVPQGEPPLAFHVVDADHLRDDAGCVLARAD